VGGNDFLDPTAVLNKVYPLHPRPDYIIGGILILRHNNTGVSGIRFTES